MDRALIQQQVRQLTDENRINDRRRDGAVAEEVLLHSRIVNDIREQVQKRLPVREIKRRIRPDLSPYEQVLSCERDLFVSVADVCPDCQHYFFLRQPYLRIQIREAKAASPAAARC